MRTKPLFWEYGRNAQSFKYPAGRDRSPNLAVRDGAAAFQAVADLRPDVITMDNGPEFVGRALDEWA